LQNYRAPVNFQNFGFIIFYRKAHGIGPWTGSTIALVHGLTTSLNGGHWILDGGLRFNLNEGVSYLLILAVGFKTCGTGRLKVVGSGVAPAHSSAIGGSPELGRPGTPVHQTR
jgi:hypothetical protein